jgi:hypothetical protein
VSEHLLEELTCDSKAGSVRRGLLKGLAAGGLVAALGRLTGKVEAAAGGICGKGCGSLCGERVALLRCSPLNENCVCFQATSGKIHCVDAGDVAAECGRADQCRTDANCGEGNICVRLGGACCPAGQRFNLCIPECSTTAARGGGQSDLVARMFARLNGR